MAFLMHVEVYTVSLPKHPDSDSDADSDADWNKEEDNWYERGFCPKPKLMRPVGTWDSPTL